MSAIDAAALQPLEPATGSTLPSPCLTWPLYQQAAGLFELESSTAAPQLLSNLGVALHAAVPSGAPSEPLYTPFWDKVGLGLPESACSILRFDVSVSRNVQDPSITVQNKRRDYMVMGGNILVVAGEDKTSRAGLLEAKGRNRWLSTGAAMPASTGPSSTSC